MADPAYAWVPIDALRDLVAYADMLRGYVDGDHVTSADDQQESDDEFRAKVHALGIEQLEH